MDNDEKNYSKFKWWVTPVNLFLISAFLLIIDYDISNGDWKKMSWSYWAVLIIWTAYLVRIYITAHPRTAWLFFPSVMFVVAIYLILIDLYTPPNEGVMGLDFALIPSSAILIFGTFIPIIAKLGTKEPSPIERFKQIEPGAEDENE